MKFQDNLITQQYLYYKIKLDYNIQTQMIKTYTLSLQTSDEVPHFTNVTQQVKEFVTKSKVKEGTVLIFSQHTTAAVVIQENEEGIFKDVKDTLELVASKTKEYQHHKVAETIPDEPLNGYAHCHHIFIDPSEIVPISKGKMMLGTYQHIFLVELDRSRPRTIVIQVSGE